MDKVAQQAACKMHSDEWFGFAFDECSAPDWAKDAARFICSVYGIKGQADPAYIANVIHEKKRF